jgi:hypothetical protein
LCLSRDERRHFVSDYNLQSASRSSKDLTPDVYICKIRVKEPERFTLDPLHQMPGPNIYLERDGIRSAVVGMSEEIGALVRRDVGQDLSDGVIDGVRCSSGGLSEPVLELGEEHLDGV